MDSIPILLERMPMFSEFTSNFRMLLSLYSDRRVYFPDSVIFEEGAEGDGLYVINVGLAQASRRGLRIDDYAGGSYFNSLIMLSTRKVNYCTLTAVELCHVVVVTHTSYYLALSKYPSQRAAKDLTKAETSMFDNFRNYVARLNTQSRRPFDKTPSGKAKNPWASFEIASRTNAELKKDVLIGWHKYTADCTKLFKQEEKRNFRMKQWIEKRQDAVQSRRQQELLQRLVHEQDAPLQAISVAKRLGPAAPRLRQVSPEEKRASSMTQHAIASARGRERIADASSIYGHQSAGRGSRLLWYCTSSQQPFSTQVRPPSTSTPRSVTPLRSPRPASSLY